MVADDAKFVDRVQAAETQCRYLEDVAKKLHQRITTLNSNGGAEDCSGRMELMKNLGEVADSLTLRLDALESLASEFVPRNNSNSIEAEEKLQLPEAGKNESSRKDAVCSSGAVQAKDRERCGQLQGMAESLLARIEGFRIDSNNVTVPSDDVLEECENEVRVLKSSVDKLENRLDVLEKISAEPRTDHVATSFEKEIKPMMIAQRADADKLKMHLEQYVQTAQLKQSSAESVMLPKNASSFDKDVMSKMMAQRGEAEKVKMNLEQYVQTVQFKQSSVDASFFDKDVKSNIMAQRGEPEKLKTAPKRFVDVDSAIGPEDDAWVPKANYEAVQKECAELSKQRAEAIRLLEHSQKELSDSQTKCSNALVALEDAQMQASQSQREVERLKTVQSVNAATRPENDACVPKASHEAVQKQCVELSRQHAEAIRSLEQTQEELADSHMKCSNALAALEDARVQASESQREVERLRTEAADAQSKNLSLVQELEACSSELQKLQHEKQDDKKMQGVDLQKVEKEKLILQQQLDRVEAQLQLEAKEAKDLMQKEIANRVILQEDNNRLRFHSDSIEQMIDKLQAENLALNNRLGSLSAEDAGAHHETAQLNYNVLKLQNDELKKQLVKNSFSEGTPTSTSVPVQQPLAAKPSPRPLSYRNRFGTDATLLGRAPVVPANRISPNISPLEAHRTVFEQTPDTFNGIADWSVYHTKISEPLVKPQFRLVTQSPNGHLSSPLSGSFVHVPYSGVSRMSSSPKSASAVIVASGLSENRQLFRTASPSTATSPSVVGRFIQVGTPTVPC